MYRRAEPKEETPLFPSLDYYEYRGPLEEAVEVARHYGFHLIEPLFISKRLPSGITDNRKENLKEKDFSGYPREKMTILRKYYDDGMHKMPQPILLCHVHSGPDGFRLQLDVMGTKKSIAEAILIKTAHVILENDGYEEICVSLNSIGEKESQANFMRELTHFYRKNISVLPAHCREKMKTDILSLLECNNEKCRSLKMEAPQSVSFLSEEGRRHFREILEFLEHSGISYRITNELVGNKTCAPKTAFQIHHETSDALDPDFLAFGERHNHLSRDIGIGKSIPVVSTLVRVSGDNRRKELYRKVPGDRIKKPPVFFAQLGYDARLRSFKVLDILRDEGVRFYQSIWKDSVSRQLRAAERLSVPFVIILGQKEVMEKTVIFRDMESRYQESVPLSDLTGYLKTLKRKKLL